MRILSESFDENCFWDTIKQIGHFRYNLAIMNARAPLYFFSARTAYMY